VLGSVKKIAAALTFSAVVFSPLVGVNPIVASYLGMSYLALFYSLRWFE